MKSIRRSLWKQDEEQVGGEKNRAGIRRRWQGYRRDDGDVNQGSISGDEGKSMDLRYIVRVELTRLGVGLNVGDERK